MLGCGVSNKEIGRSWFFLVAGCCLEEFLLNNIPFNKLLMPESNTFLKQKKKQKFKET